MIRDVHPGSLFFTQFGSWGQKGTGGSLSGSATLEGWNIVKFSLPRLLQHIFGPCIRNQEYWI
jgi:hypothetical protein